LNLDMRVPADLYESSSRSMPWQLPDHQYPEAFEIRRIRGAPSISGLRAWLPLARVVRAPSRAADMPAMLAVTSIDFFRHAPRLTVTVRRSAPSRPPSPAEGAVRPLVRFPIEWDLAEVAGFPGGSPIPTSTTT
jgi:hypothetical protein